VLPTTVACATNPSASGCPPANSQQPGSPVVQENNHLVNLVNNSIEQVTSSTSGNTNTNANTQGSSQDSGAKANEQTKKMYCN